MFRVNPVVGAGSSWALPESDVSLGLRSRRSLARKFHQLTAEADDRPAITSLRLLAVRKDRKVVASPLPPLGIASLFFGRGCKLRKSWYARRDSNARPFAPEANALSS